MDACKNHSCYENNPSDPAYCITRDNCPSYDIRKDHERIDQLIWLYILKNQGHTFHTARGLPFTYQVQDDKGRETLLTSRSVIPYRKEAVQAGLDRDIGESYHGQSYIQPLVETFLGELGR